MAKSLVLTVDNNTTLAEIEKFVQAAKEFDLVTGKTPVSAFAKHTKKMEESGEIAMRLILNVPEPPKAKPKKPTKKQLAAKKQIEEHREKKKNGESVPGYVPPVGRKTAPKTKKVKCPVCGFRKPLVTVSGQKVIKPHVSKGDPCPGSGRQYVQRNKTKKEKAKSGT